MQISVCRFILYLILSFTMFTVDARNNNLVENLVHQGIQHSVKRSISTQPRQEECSSILDDYPTAECNASMLAGNLTFSPTSTYSESELEALNDAYVDVCVSKCIDPITRFYQCTFSEDTSSYLTNLIRRGVCGKDDGDFCEVKYLRKYSGDLGFFERLIEECPFENSGIDCSYGASATCENMLSNFNTKMGCCTSPYLGGELSACRLDSAIDQPCESFVSSGNFVTITTAVLVLPLIVTAVF